MRLTHIDKKTHRFWIKLADSNQMFSQLDAKLQQTNKHCDQNAFPIYHQGACN